MLDQVQPITENRIVRTVPAPAISVVKPSLPAMSPKLYSAS